MTPLSKYYYAKTQLQLLREYAIAADKSYEDAQIHSNFKQYLAEFKQRNNKVADVDDLLTQLCWMNWKIHTDSDVIVAKKKNKEIYIRSSSSVFKYVEKINGDYHENIFTHNFNKFLMFIYDFVEIEIVNHLD